MAIRILLPGQHIPLSVVHRRDAEVRLGAERSPDLQWRHGVISGGERRGERILRSRDRRAFERVNCAVYSYPPWFRRLRTEAKTDPQAPQLADFRRGAVPACRSRLSPRWHGRAAPGCR
jgi:hypothetical protein